MENLCAKKVPAIANSQFSQGVLEKLAVGMNTVTHSGLQTTLTVMLNLVLEKLASRRYWSDSVNFRSDVGIMKRSAALKAEARGRRREQGGALGRHRRSKDGSFE